MASTYLDQGRSVFFGPVYMVQTPMGTVWGFATIDPSEDWRQFDRCTFSLQNEALKNRRAAMRHCSENGRMPSLIQEKRQWDSLSELARKRRNEIRQSK